MDRRNFLGAAAGAVIAARASPGNAAGFPGEARFESGVGQVRLVELYTSEGCSSCPPADRWLSDLATRTGTWRDYVPIALHVDYWDDLGWQDRFSSPRFSARQRELAREAGARSIYTPGLFVDGEEWLDWRRGATPPRSASRPGSLAIAVQGEHIRAAFAPRTSLAHPTLHVARLGMGLVTRVQAGENSGRSLHHDFVVLGLDNVALAPAEDGQLRADLPLPRLSQPAAQPGIAAWVSANGTAAALQAVGGLLGV